MVRRALLGAVAVAMLLAGCGGGKSSPTSAADWASSYCSAAASWTTEFQSARAGVKAANGAPAAVDSAVSAVSLATTTFSLALDLPYGFDDLLAH